jgi:hypothetical protein
MIAALRQQLDAKTAALANAEAFVAQAKEKVKLSEI